MKVENKTKAKIIKFLNGKTFYVVLCICFVGIGVAAWSGVQGFKAINELNNPRNKSSNPSMVSDSPLITGDNNSSQDDSAAASEDKTGSSVADKSSGIGTDAGEPETKVEETAGTVATFFINPVLGTVIKDFSDSELQYSMTYRDMRIHKGVDISAAAGTAVTAAGSGKVTAIETDALYGSLVEIDHGNGITARYCGLNGTPCVNVGDTVDSSTQLGTIDVIPCESVEERHLHLEFYLNGKAVSPLKYINQ